MERGCRFFLFFLFSLVIVLTSAPAVDASIELRIDGETVPARSALALLGTGLGIAKADRAGTVSPSNRKSTRLNSSHVKISYAVFCLKKKKQNYATQAGRQNELQSD